MNDIIYRQKHVPDSRPHNMIESYADDIINYDSECCVR